MTVSEAVRLTQLRIRDTAREEAHAQAKELVAFLLGIDPAALMLHHHVELTREQLVALGGYAERRAAGEPLQYILSQWEFMGLPFAVDERVLIPRQDTETLCEAALALARARNYRTALDLCCGSGCIGVALCKLGGLAVVCSDISPDAAHMTAENAEWNDVSVDVRTGDLFDTVQEESFDLIVCNPPYLSDADMQSLQRELTYEPRTALYGGADGLDFYRRIAAEYEAHLRSGGALLMEIGSTQAAQVSAMLQTRA